MRRLDAHIHIESPIYSQQALLARLQQAGMDGGVLISQPPEEAVFPGGVPFEKRLANVLELAEGQPQRLFPALWIHPLEDSPLEKAREAAQRGIVAFKIICDSFYPGDEACLRLAAEMAKLQKPVIFHAGILWDGGVTSKYNRPLLFEELLPIEGLRFSMAHCAWPWIDECLAVYGKFLNSLVFGEKNTAEMFMDLTPGTPRIYRKELIEKLFTIGYDVGANLMFGTDCYTEDYNVQWCVDWQEIDDALYTSLALPEEVLQQVYEKNLLRFLGLAEGDYTHKLPRTSVVDEES